MRCWWSRGSACARHYCGGLHEHHGRLLLGIVNNAPAAVHNCIIGPELPCSRHPNCDSCATDKLPLAMCAGAGEHGAAHGLYNLFMSGNEEALLVMVTAPLQVQHSKCNCNASAEEQQFVM